MSDSLEGYPLSNNQSSRWRRLEAQGFRGGVVGVIRCTTPPSQQELTSALSALLGKHEILRTHYPRLESMVVPIQSISEAVDHFSVARAPSCPPLDALMETTWSSSKENLRLYLCGAEQETQVLVVHAHPLCADKPSMRNLVADLSRHLGGTEGAELPEVVQYVDFVQWEIENEAARAQRPRQAPSDGGGHAQRLPLARGSDAGTGRWAKVGFCVDNAVIDAAVAGEGLTREDVWRGVVLLALAKYCGVNGTGLSVALEFPCRSFAELGSAIGLFACRVHTLVTVNQEQSFVRLCADLAMQSRHAAENRPYPSGDGGAVSAEVNYSYTGPMQGELDGDTALRIEDVFELEPEDGISISVVELRDTTRLSVAFDRERYDLASVERFLENVRALLFDCTRHPQRRCTELNILCEGEWRRLVEEFNDTSLTLGEPSSIHRLIEGQVESAPDAIAVHCGGRRLTYAELNRKANQLARCLSEIDPAAEHVAISIRRSADMIVAALAVLKAGKAYLPIEPGLPAKRTQWLLENQRIRTLITDKSVVAENGESISASAVKNLFVCDEPNDAEYGKVRVIGSNTLARYDGENLRGDVPPGSTAYTIFTSGTTGTPKGVVVTHAPVVNTIRWVNRNLNVRESDCLLFVTSLSFDLSVYDIFGTLAAGASIQVATDEDLGSPESLVELLCNGRVTIWDSAPGALARVAPFFEQATALSQSALRLVLLSGDWIPLSLPGQVWAAFEGARVISLGGATEATIWSNYHFIESVDLSRPSIPYGRPISNARYYVLNEALLPCPEGVIGELYIGGECLASGYFNDPELTNAKFIPDPFSKVPGARLYRTGDLARHYFDGELEIIGRVDNQVKIRGYRIELGEIEANLRAIEGVKDCVTLVKTDSNGSRSLVSFYLAASPLDEAVFKSELSLVLPQYMVPESYVYLEAFPVTENGKIDRRAMLEREAELRSSLSKHVPPSSDVEKILAEVWSAILKKPNLSIATPFTELGGDSIAGMAIIAEARKRGLTLSPRQFMENDTIQKAARVARFVDRTSEPNEEFVGEIPLTPNRFWYFSRTKDLDKWSLYQSLYYEHGLLDANLVKQVIKACVESHAALRVRFERDGSRWREMISPSEEVELLTVYDYSGGGDSAYEHDREAFLSKLCLSKQLFHVALFTFGADRDDEILMICHHLATDAYSLRLFKEDLTENIERIHSGSRVRVPRPATDLAGWAKALVSAANSEAMERSMPYWRSRAWGRVSSLRTDGPRSGNIMKHNTSLTRVLTAEETRGFYSLLRRSENALDMAALLYVLYEAIAGWSPVDMLQVELVTHGREAFAPDVDVSRTLGWFNDFVPFVYRVSEDVGVVDALRSLQRELVESASNGKSYGCLRYLNEKAEIGEFFAQLPEAEIAFNYIPPSLESGSREAVFGPGAKCLPKGESRSVETHGGERERVHLMTCQIQVIGEELNVRWFYSAAVYEESTIGRLSELYMARLRNLLNGGLWGESIRTRGGREDEPAVSAGMRE